METTEGTETNIHRAPADPPIPETQEGSLQAPHPVGIWKTWGPDVGAGAPILQWVSGWNSKPGQPSLVYLPLEPLKALAGTGLVPLLLVTQAGLRLPQLCRERVGRGQRGRILRHPQGHPGPCHLRDKLPSSADSRLCLPLGTLPSPSPRRPQGPAPAEKPQDVN